MTAFQFKCFMRGLTGQRAPDEWGTLGTANWRWYSNGEEVRLWFWVILWHLGFIGFGFALARIWS